MALCHTFELMERRALPAHPKHITFRGRYRHVDERLVDLCGIAQLKRGARIRVLDVGCGILPFGSPTLHDLWDAIRQRGTTPYLIGMDKRVPKRNRALSYKSIRYTKSLRGFGTFDIVRMLDLWEHVPQRAYLELRETALRRLREGGCFVATQALGVWDLSDAAVKFKSSGEGPVIKIAQKRNGCLVPVDILPDTLLPWPRYHPPEGTQKMKEYKAYRERVARGKTAVPTEPDLESFRAFIRVFETYPPRVLLEESPEMQLSLGLYNGRTSEPKGSMEAIRDAAKETAARFREDDAYRHLLPAARAAL